jgi:nucleoside-diphosphate-sugar epimerase
MFKVYLVNTHVFPTPGTHFFTISKFVKGFKQNGYYTETITSFDNINDAKFNIFVMADHHQNIDKLNELRDKYENSIFILWFHHRWYDKIKLKNFIITGEHFHEKPILEEHLKCWELQQNINNYVPLTFATSINPNELQKNIRLDDVYDCCFIGNSYYTNITKLIPNSFVYDYNHNGGRFLDEDERINIYRSSIVSLGFHHKNNVFNNVVVERVFEAMAYGCIVITDSLAAEKLTNGIVKKIDSFSEISDIIKYYKNNPEERKKKQQDGYEWIKKYGTYKHISNNFIQKIKELFFNKNVLITGGCGFVGRHFVSYLLNTSQYNITVVDNLISKGSHINDTIKKTKIINDDCRNFFKYNEEQYDIVIHLAATVEGRESIENELFKVGENIDIDMKFFDWCRKTNPLKIIYFSSSAAYPIKYQTFDNCRKLSEDLLDFENDNIGIPDMTYGWAKLTGEFLAYLCRKKYNLDIICFRPFSGYGNDQDLSYPYPSILERVINKEDPITIWSDSVRDFVHIDDIVCFVMNMMYVANKNVYNIGTSIPTSFKELANKMCNIMNHKPINDIKILDNKPSGVYYRVSANNLLINYKTVEEIIQSNNL